MRYKIICTAQHVKCIHCPSPSFGNSKKKKTCTNSIFVFKKMIDIRAGRELLGSEEKLLHDSNIPIYYTLNLQPKKESINE